MSNIYDNNVFFEKYAQMDRSKKGLNYAGEWHQFKNMFPDLKNKRLLDLGCGYGWHCKYAINLGAKDVLGIDISQKMIDRAMQLNKHDNIEYLVSNLDEYAYPSDSWDVVISNLVLHYVEDIESIFNKIFNTLKAGGTFLLNIEHPIFTSGINQDWIYDKHNKPLYWPIDNYFYPGERKTIFLKQEITKYHHTLTQIINGLIKTGFIIQNLEEAMPSQEMLKIEGMENELRRPMMLLIKASKL